jgi:hypothetical protein
LLTTQRPYQRPARYRQGSVDDLIWQAGCRIGEA